MHADYLFTLTKNLTAQSAHLNYAVLPISTDAKKSFEKTEPFQPLSCIQVERVKQGGEDLTDFERYVAEYSPQLTRFCMKLCGNIDDAEDLFQDTWARAFDKIDQYRPAYSFESWLFAIWVHPTYAKDHIAAAVKAFRKVADQMMK